VTVATLTAAPPIRSHRWTCSGCNVSVRLASGALIAEPNGWADGLCIACQRKEAHEEKGSEALLRYELRRGTGLRLAAKRACVSDQFARSIRTLMVRAGEIEAPRAPDAPRQPSAQEQRRKAVEAALRSDPGRGDDEIAAATGSSPSTVKRRRKALGIEPVFRTRATHDFAVEDAEMLRRRGPMGATAFAAAVRRSYPTAATRLRALVDAGLAVAEGGGTRGSVRTYRAV
jgi:hypothetical protein